VKILHTSDWHIGRTFHGYSTLANLRVALDALAEAVRTHAIDVVVVAGDVFDSSTPSADSYAVLSHALRAIRAAGAVVVMTSGNHDSSTRLGFQSEWASEAGIHILTQQHQHSEPVVISDEYGTVLFYGIPYLEPSLLRHHYPDVELRNHEQVLDFAMRRIRADLTVKGSPRSVVISHCFAVGVAASDVERDITAGGLDYVPVASFAGPDYAALGHIHGRQTLTERVRYSGAPLHYSFAEANKPRGGWIVELDAAGLDTVEWLELPIPRPLVVLTGELDEIIGDPANLNAETAWVCAILTDTVRPLDAMRKLQARFPWCVTLEHRPSVVAETSNTSYRDRVATKSDREIIAGFLEYVRNGEGPSEAENTLISDVITANAVREAGL
jgi:exonuclease SbcD